jgi:hypothetical protein
MRYNPLIVGTYYTCKLHRTNRIFGSKNDMGLLDIRIMHDLMLLFSATSYNDS